MAENSKIAWTDDTFNPWWGCKRVGPGCDHCYAATLDKRTGGSHWDGDTLPRRTSEQNWAKPRRWNKTAEAAGIRRKVFCASMADVFDNRVPPEWRTDLFDLIRETPHLDWILLTKRIGNVAKMLPADWGQGWQNVWLLITVVNQKEADRDIPKLFEIPAVVRGLSIEPQLEDIDLEYPKSFFPDGPRYCCNQFDCGCMGRPVDPPMICNIDWIITGAESGPGHRPYDDDWARSLRDQCQATGTAFFFKQHIRGGKKVETPELDGRRWMEFPK